MIICGVGDAADDDGGDGHGGGDDHGGDDGDKSGKMRKSKFLKIVKKSSKMTKIIQNRKTFKIKISFRCVKLRENPKTRVSRFLPFYLLIWAFQTLSRISNDGI